MKTEPTREPHEPFVDTRMPTARARELTPAAKNAAVWRKPYLPMASSLM
jgi:hypothetical protein